MTNKNDLKLSDSFQDLAYQFSDSKNVELNHEYGEQFHFYSNPYSTTLVSQIGHPQTTQKDLFFYIRKSYEYLLQQMMSYYFPKVIRSVETRMHQSTERGIYHGHVIDPTLSFCLIDIARAGMIPAQTCFEFLSFFYPTSQLTQDHLFVQRMTNEKGQVTGAHFHDSKTTKNIDQKILVIPDPMGATGSSMIKVVDHYHKNSKGTPAAICAMHLIVTPEYIQKIKKECPQLQVFALRLDRGFSTEAALKKKPGTLPKEESGLNEIQYIIPGAGGMGEVLNNNFD